MAVKSRPRHGDGARIQPQSFIYRDQMNEKRWQSYFPETDLWNQTLIIIGFGDLGRNIARKANAFGIHTIVFRRTMSEKPEYVDELYPIDLLDEHIHRADYLVLAPAATAETLSILNRGRLFAMKKGAYVINVSRGTLLDEEALIDALKSGHLGGAGLDVTTVEPLDSSSELWGMKNVLITPTPADWRRTASIPSLRSFRKSRPLPD